MPTAARAQSAAQAASAERAEAAVRADLVEQVPLAESADHADHATEATSASSAEFAPTAADSQRLGGLAADAFLSRCDPGTPKAVVEIDARAEELPRPFGFNCKGGMSVTRGHVPEQGDYEVRLDGIFDGSAVVSAFGINSAAVVSGTGPIFRVHVFSVTGSFLLPREPFVLAVF